MFELLAGELLGEEFLAEASVCITDEDLAMFLRDVKKCMDDRLEQVESVGGREGEVRADTLVVLDVGVDEGAEVSVEVCVLAGRASEYLGTFLVAVAKGCGGGTIRSDS